VRTQNWQLLAAKVSKLEFPGQWGKFSRHFNGLSSIGNMGVRPCLVSQPIRRSACLPRKPENQPEMAAFRAFDFVSRLPNRESPGADRRKSPATRANVPVLQRLSVETGFVHRCRTEVPGQRPTSPTRNLTMILTPGWNACRTSLARPRSGRAFTPGSSATLGKSC
jgi:hypothetical protein